MLRNHLLLLLTVPALLGASLEDPIPEPIVPGEVVVDLEELAGGFVLPIVATHAPGDARQVFVADQPGVVYAIDLESGARRIFLDLRDRVPPLGINGPGTPDQRGLLGFEFHPQYASNGRVYSYLVTGADGPADFSIEPVPPGGHPFQAILEEWRVPDPGAPDASVDPLSARELMRIDQPAFDHNGGTFAFALDGLLYLAMGDGGATVSALERSQDTSNIYGNILRLDVDGSNSANGQYGIPSGNPFVGLPGLDEIYAFGFRNPYRISVDRELGDLWVADVGQLQIEEVDVVVAGRNYGWSLKEGSFFRTGLVGVTDVDPGNVPADVVDPVAEYDRDEGFAVIGGYVYHGAEIPRLVGRYVFGDFAGRLFHLDADDRIREIVVADAPPGRRFVLAFGEAPSGELYLLTSEIGLPTGDTGRLLRVRPRPIEARIDVLPARDPNVVRPVSPVLVQVALFGADDVDVAQLDEGSLRFAGAAAIPGYGRRTRDLDDDGRPDRSLAFLVDAGELPAGESTVCLTGLLGLDPFEGCDVLRVLAPGAPFGAARRR